MNCYAVIPRNDNVIQFAYLSLGDDKSFFPFIHNYCDYKFLQLVAENAIVNGAIVNAEKFTIIREIDYESLTEITYKLPLCGPLTIYLESGKIIDYCGFIPLEIIEELLLYCKDSSIKHLLTQKKNKIILLEKMYNEINTLQVLSQEYSNTYLNVNNTYHNDAVTSDNFAAKK